MRYVVRPISDRTWMGTMPRSNSRFRASWSDTLILLGQELDHFDARDIVLEIDVQETDLKLNGELRANARPTSSAVAIAFEGKHGPMYWPCDRFYTEYSWQGPEWQHNVRAIAKTMEALRAADRYGATGRGQQYVGFKQLGAGTAMVAPTSSHLTSSDAQRLVLALAGETSWPTSDSGIARVVRRAKFVAHPDRNAGDHSEWGELAEALTVLRLS
jgi:hypothetical protein